MWARALWLGVLGAVNVAAADKLADTQFDWGDVKPVQGARLLPAKSCVEVVATYKAVAGVSSKPPREMPPALVAGYTMGGQVEVGEMFVDDTLGGKGSHYQYPATDVLAMIEAAAGYIAGKNTRRLPPMDQWLLKALQQHGAAMKGANVVVFGSMQPWYEAIAVASGARSVYTIEYNKLTYTHPKMTQSTPADVTIPDGGFDIAFSISSFDHDGLGRYGDPVSPNADVAAMRLARCMLRPGGLLFVTLPVGPDVVVWNLHRRYGPLRLAHMLDGFDLVGTEGYSRARFGAEASFRKSFEPVFVLRRPMDDDGSNGVGGHDDVLAGETADKQRSEL